MLSKNNPGRNTKIIQQTYCTILTVNVISLRKNKLQNIVFKIYKKLNL